MTDLSRRLREPLPLVLLILAVAGWIAFLAMWINSTLQQSQQQDSLALLLHDRDQLSATLAERERTQGAISQAQAKLLDVEHQLGSVSTAFSAASTELDARQNELAQTVAALETAKTETADLLDRADAATQLLSEAATRQASIQAETQSASRQLADVDTRLTDARRQEEAATANLAQMAQEAAKNTSILAETQSQLQSSRVELTEAQNRLSEAKAQAEAAIAAAQSAQAQLDQLTQSKATLETQVAAYAEQLKTLQPQVEELTRTLAQRSNALQNVESTIAQVITPTSTESSYQTSSGLTMTMTESGSFTLSDSINRTVSGRYEIMGDELVLSDATGRLGNAKFPMTCSYNKTEAGFELGDTDGCTLSGLSFTEQPTNSGN